MKKNKTDWRYIISIVIVFALAPFAVDSMARMSKEHAEKAVKSGHERGKRVLAPELEKKKLGEQRPSRN